MSARAPGPGEAAPSSRPAAAPERPVSARASPEEGCLLSCQALAAALFAFYISIHVIAVARGHLRAHFLQSLSLQSDSRLRAGEPPKGTSPPPHRAGRGCEARFPFFSSPRCIPLPRSSAVWLPPWIHAQRPERRRFGQAKSGRDVGTARGRPALRESPSRCSRARWVVGEAGASAWLSLLRPRGLRKFGMGCFPLGWLVSQGPHPASAGSSHPRLRCADFPAPPSPCITP